MTQFLYLSRIGELMPDLYAHDIEQMRGQFNDVLIANHEWVFRFPRYRDGVDRLLHEIDLLKTLQGKLPCAVPDPLVSALEPPIPGLAVCGHRYIPGKPLTADAVQSLNPAACESLAGQMASILCALHRQPLVGLPACLPGGSPEVNYSAIKVRDLRPEWEAMFASIKTTLFPSMHPSARRAVTEHFEIYLSSPQLNKFIPCLRHGDFGGDNILWDCASGKITGVVDFTFCALGDPAMDLAAASTLGEQFFTSLMAQYEPDEPARKWLLGRAIFYRYLFPLMEALDGMKYGDEMAYTRGMASFV